MPDNKQEVAGSVITETAPETVVVGKTKKVKTGNLIMDIAHEVEVLTKTKALNEAERLADDIETNYFRLGGVLKLINDNSWFEGFESFDLMVYEKFGFQGRKARYLIQIYDNLVTNQIPWEKVGHLGWTKLKDLTPVLTADNVDEWVKKAENATVAELQAMLKAKPDQGTDKSEKTTDDIVKRTFKFKAEQNEAVDQALAKAKGELKTEFDTVAMAAICAGYLGNVSSVTPFDVDDLIKTMGMQPMLNRIAELFPEWDISIGPAEKATANVQDAQTQELVGAAKA